MAEQAIYTQLQTVTALGDRIYPLVLPQNVKYPAVTYERLDATRYSSFGDDETLAEATVEVSIYGRRNEGYEAHRSVTEACRAVLQRQAQGNVTDMFLDDEEDDYEDATDLYVKTYDVRVWYTET